MKEQNFSNHGRYIILYHFVTLGGIIAVFVGSIVNLVRSSREDLNAALLLVAISLILASLALFGRQFALRAQDRAIRAEENFRHFILSGKSLDRRLTMGQVIALRFASDGEFLALCIQAAENGMKPKEIKKTIRQWRADHHRA